MKKYESPRFEALKLQKDAFILMVSEGPTAPPFTPGDAPTRRYRPI